MTTLAAARVVTPSAVLEPGTVVLEGDRIVEVRAGARPPTDDPSFRRTIVPGFVDVHVHGTAGVDTLAGAGSIADIARRLPQFGVTAFCPTSVACPPAVLRAFLDDVNGARAEGAPGASRVLGAHLESNFINPEYAGAQPATCLCLPPAAPEPRGTARDFDGAAIWAELTRRASDVRIVTMAPELPGGPELVRALVDAGHRVSLGHSGATYEQGLDAIAAGARHATHLFNRMPPLLHRTPGLAGAVLTHPDVLVEIILDTHHVHPAMARVALAALGASRTIAITDGTAAVGLAPGTRTRLGSHAIVAGTDVARLEDGTVAGSVLTMDAAFRNLVRLLGADLVAAARACSTNPARAAGLAGAGALVPGNLADLVVLDDELRVAQTFVAGRPVFTV